jgi:hypothetical protein
LNSFSRAVSLPVLTSQRGADEYKEEIIWEKVEKFLPDQRSDPHASGRKMKAFWAVENFAGFGIRFALFPARGLER